MQRPVVMALVWLFGLGGLGVWFPFISLYLDENLGLSGIQLGIAIALIPLVGILAQPFWGQISDRSGSRARVLALIALGSACGYTLLSLPTSFVGIALAIAGLALFSSALIPMYVSVTLALTRDGNPRSFGLVRMWGTIGFLIAVVGFPYLLDAHQAGAGLVANPEAGLSEPGLEIMFPIAGALVAVSGLIALALPGGGAVSARAGAGDWRVLLRHGPFVRLLGFAFLAYFALQGPQFLFPVYVRSLGGSIDSISQLWILMLLLEIPLIGFAGATLERVGARGLLAIGVIAGGVRWIVCGLATDLAWVYPVAVLHGVVVMGLVIGGSLYVDQVVPQRLRSTGQGLLAMLGVSLGGLCSNLGTGWLRDLTDTATPYLWGGVASLLLGLLVPVMLPKPTRPDDQASRPDEQAAEAEASGLEDAEPGRG
jgi:PPP family 3-phenylpropionic acid transporter